MGKSCEALEGGRSEFGKTSQEFQVLRISRQAGALLELASQWSQARGFQAQISHPTQQHSTVIIARVD